MFEMLGKAAAVSDMTPYRYRPLNYPDEIRLVRIMPGPTSEQDIRCEIIHRRKSSNNLNYEAISYAWGTLSTIKTIGISPELSKLWITSNCFDVLRRLRYEEKTRLVWIDALCINQNDNEEKVNQVRIMGEIYAQSKRVIVYLGEADNTSSRLFEYMRSNFERCNSIQSDNHDWPVAVVEAARAFLKRPWFSRVWVLQEVLNGIESAKSGVRLVCGSDKIAWEVFALTCTEFCKSNASGFDSYSLAVPYILEIGSGKEQKSLFEILCGTRSSNATDPRDKFFGVLSLVQEQETIRNLATYDQTTTMVYTTIGLHLISKYQLLILQPIRHPHNTFPNLASWIPDWSRTDANDPFWLDMPENESFFEKRSFVPEIRTLECCQSNNPGSDHLFHPILPVTGFRFGKIKSLGAVFDFENSREQCFDGIKQVIDTDGHCKNNPYLPPAFMPAYYDREAFHYLFSAGCTTTNLSLDISPFYEGALHKCRLFLDDNNESGIAPLEVEVGDWVCALPGAIKFCILRARSDGGWTLISGECYMHESPYVTDPDGDLIAPVESFCSESEVFMIW